MYFSVCSHFWCCSFFLCPKEIKYVRHYRVYPQAKLEHKLQKKTCFKWQFICLTLQKTFVCVTGVDQHWSTADFRQSIFCRLTYRFYIILLLMKSQPTFMSTSFFPFQLASLCVHTHTPTPPVTNCTLPRPFSLACFLSCYICPTDFSTGSMFYKVGPKPPPPLRITRLGFTYSSIL